MKSAASLEDPRPKLGLKASGNKLLEICSYDHRLTGVTIALQDNWRELLETISSGQLQRNVAYVVWQIREASGKDFDRAKELAQGS